MDWTHLGAQIVSFGIVCAVLYRLAYTPILAMLEARRQQIASGLANADEDQGGTGADRGRADGHPDPRG